MYTMVLSHGGNCGKQIIGVIVKKLVEIWKELDVLVDSHPNTTYQWVKGHNGTHWNVQADRLATSTI